MISTTTNQDLPRVDDLQAAIDRVTDIYHGPLEPHLSRVDRLMTHVAARYGLAYFKLQPIAQLFVELQRELRCHVADWEELLVPLLRHLCTNQGNAVGASDALIALIREGKQNDERIARLFRQMAALTDDYNPAANSCSAYQDILHALGTLDQRTRMHFKVEEELLTRAGRAPNAAQP